MLKVTMPKVSIIIAEKPSVAASIAKAFIPKGSDIEDYSWHDEFEYNPDNQRVAPEKDSDRYYWQKDFSTNRKIIAIHPQTALGRNKRRPRSLSERPSKDGHRRERVIYYIIPTANSSADFIMICDTQGNPLNQRIDTNIRANKNADTDLLLQCENWNKYGEKFQLRVSRDGPWGRMSWFRFVIARQAFPCDGDGFRRGQPFELQRVYAATDFDTAGQYISYSVFHYCRQAYGSKFVPRIPLEDALLVRLDMSDLSPARLRSAFESPEEFSWGMAFGGMTRAKLDFMVGLFSGRVLNGAWRSIVSKHNLPKQFEKLPFGRVQTGALNVLCDQFYLLNTKPTKQLYLIFNGIVGWDELRQLIDEKALAWIQVIETERTISHAQFLRACQTEKVGTHTTRYTQLKTLIENNLAFSGARDVVPTTFGTLYKEWLKTGLEYTVLNPKELNRRLHDLMKELEGCLSKDDGHAKSEAFLSKFFEKYRNLILGSGQELRNRDSFLAANRIQD